MSRALPTLCLSLLLIAGFVAGCGAKDEAAAAPQGPETWFEIKVGDKVVRMQVAARPEEIQRGLMFRKELGRDEGMLFVFTRPQPLGFYMRNTTIPLDIGYFDPAGELKEIYAMHALDERSVPSRSRSLQFALEMNQGWYREAGVRPGAKLDLKAVAGALRARGLDPTAAGLPEPAK